MKRNYLTGDKIGVIFGTFAPMHVGHVDLITKAKRENDSVLVVVSGSNTDRDRGTQAGLPLDKRFRYVREVFRGDDLVIIDKLNEEDMPAYPNGWGPWLDALNNLIEDNSRGNFESLNFYVGEKEYVQPLKGFFCEHTEVTLVERSVIPISATKIRENPYQYWGYITKPFRRHFTKKVLVVGSASGGKTTLVRDLGRVYNAPVSLEYAREYQDMYNVRDDELSVNDYVHLLADQYAQTSNIIDEGSHSGLIFADTNSTVTKAYIDYYLKDEISNEDFNMLTQLYEATFAREKWDLIILIPPKTEYVDDGFRDMSMSDQSIRDEFTNHLIELLEPLKENLVVLDSAADNFFVANYEAVKSIIKEHLGFDI